MNNIKYLINISFWYLCIFYLYRIVRENSLDFERNKKWISLTMIRVFFLRLCTDHYLINSKILENRLSLDRLESYFFLIFPQLPE
jgi:hypothetical protein